MIRLRRYRFLEWGLSLDEVGGLLRTCSGIASPLMVTKEAPVPHHVLYIVDVVLVVP